MKPKFNLNNKIMKTLQKTTVLFLLGFLLSTISFSQIVISDKLEEPELESTHTYLNRSQVWISGEWTIDNSQYVWKEGHWTDKRPGYIFLPGYWKKVKGGWTWISGSWKEISMEKWNNIYA